MGGTQENLLRALNLARAEADAPSAMGSVWRNLSTSPTLEIQIIADKYGNVSL